jgi:hypothetical protein
MKARLLKLALLLQEAAKQRVFHDRASLLNQGQGVASYVYQHNAYIREYNKTRYWWILPRKYLA